MRAYTLRGIAEGLVGRSTVCANSIKDLFERYPVLALHRSKLVIDGTRVSGYAPCDG